MDFYLDENLPKRTAHGINAFEGEKRLHNVYSTEEAFAKGIKDVDLFPLIKEKNGILITNDAKITTRKNEFEVLKALGISVFIVSFPSGADYWTKTKFLVNKWQEIVEIAEKNKKPFVCKIKVKGRPEIST